MMIMMNNMNIILNIRVNNKNITKNKNNIKYNYKSKK